MSLMIERWGRLLTAVLVFTSMSSVHAQEQNQAAVVSAMRKQLRSSYTSPEKLPEILDQVLAERKVLIAANPGHPDMMFWRTAQAEDALEGLQINAIELTVRHGLPGNEQQELMDALIREALDQTTAIQAKLPEALASAEADSSRQERLQALSEAQWPWLRGWALGLAASRGLVEDSDSTCREAIALMEQARPALRGATRDTLARQLAMARLTLGELDLARSDLETLRRSTTAGALDLLGARAGLIDLRFKESGPIDAAGDAQISAATSSDPLERLMLIEMAAQYWIRASREVAPNVDDPARADEQRKDLEFNAVEAFLLLQPETGGISLGQQQHLLDLLIEQRLGRLQFADPMADHLPASVVIASAVPMAQSPDTAQQAYDMLAPLVDQPGLVPRQRPRILSILAVASMNAGDRISAIDHAIQWSQVAIDRPESHQAAELAATLAAQEAAERPDDVRATELRDRAVNNLLIHFPDHVNLNKWRLQAGQWAQAMGQVEAATTHYESIEGDAPERITAIRQMAMMMFLGLNRLAPAERSGFLPGTAARIEAMDRELLGLAQQSPGEAVRVHSTLDWIKARLDMMQGNPVKALNKLSGLDLSVVEPDLQVPIHIAKLEASIMTGREGAVRAVIDSLPPEFRSEIARGVLPLTAGFPGRPLPLDPIEDPGMAMASVSLGRFLLEEDTLDDATLVLAVESLRRGGQPDEAFQAADAVLKDRPDLAAALLCKAECMRVLPDPDVAELITIYARLCKADPEANPIRFWTSQLRLLQLMKSNGRDPADVMARLNRLRQQHPDLGGPPFDGQFALLAADYFPDEDSD